jgi:hypothetical protein
VNHANDEVTVKMWANLNEAASNESWGISHFEMFALVGNSCD